MLVCVVVTSDDGQILHIEARLMEFVHARFGGVVRLIDRHYGVVGFVFVDHWSVFV